MIEELLQIGVGLGVVLAGLFCAWAAFDKREGTEWLLLFLGLVILAIGGLIWAL